MTPGRPTLAPDPDSAPPRAPRGAPGGGAPLPCPDPEGPEQHLSHACEQMRITLLHDTRIYWQDRARQATSETSAEYAYARAGSLGRPLGPRVARCGSTLFAVRCGDLSRAPVLVPRGCRQWWVCRSCRRRRSNSLRVRITDGLVAAWSRSTAGGRRCGLRLLTLTVRHSGVVDRDRRALVDGWRAMYKGLRRWLGLAPYVATWEVTPGRDGRGHVHMHVVVIWPRWVDYGRVRALWLRACPESERISIVGGSNSLERAANYVAKYISKGVELSGFTDELRAEVLASFYNARLVLTSHKFWGPKVCKCCGEPWRRVVTSWGDVLSRHPGLALGEPEPASRGGPGDAPGVPGGQRAFVLPGGLRLVLDRW